MFASLNTLRKTSFDDVFTVNVDDNTEINNVIVKIDNLKIPHLKFLIFYLLLVDENIRVIVQVPAAAAPVSATEFGRKRRNAEVEISESNWKSDVLFINEYDTLLGADDDVKPHSLEQFDGKLTIVPEVIKDIYEWANGHAGLVYLCGKAISSLEKELDERRCLDFVLWSNFVASLQPTVRFFDFIQIHDLEEEDKQIS
ncbi:hypothetical protein C1646_753811 [Rhizophagus diaphanus]|nr:hypothetical protein C1646_753811 [Rhizophagus diaphanus] [Rhizophagus sp. MUCL 43196]